MAGLFRRVLSRDSNPDWLSPSDPAIILIEAPGKLDALRKALDSSGLGHIEIMATKGHVMGMPQSLSPLGIDRNLRETLRNLVNNDRWGKIAGACTGKTVLVMTDPDHEGEVIADDLVRLLEEPAPRGKLPRRILRARAASMAAEDVMEGLRHARPHEPALALPGRARALADRLIGATLSENGIAAGRVFTPAFMSIAERIDGKFGIGALPDRAAPVAEALFRVHVAGSGAPFEMTRPVTSIREFVDGNDLLAAAHPSQKDIIRRPATGKAPTTLDILVAAETALGWQPGRTAAAMQGAYQKGRLSYPRTDGDHVNESHLSRVQGLAATCGIAVDLRAFAKHALTVTPQDLDSQSWRHHAPGIGAPPPEGSQSHEGLHPIDFRGFVPDIRLLSDEEAIVQLVAGQVMLAGVSIEQVTVFIDSDSTPQVTLTRPPEALERLTRSNRPKSGYCPWSPHRLFLEVAARELKLGRPSTWPALSDKFAERELVFSGPDGWRLTNKGALWAAKARRQQDLGFAWPQMRMMSDLLEAPPPRFMDADRHGRDLGDHLFKGDFLQLGLEGEMAAAVAERVDCAMRNSALRLYGEIKARAAWSPAKTAKKELLIETGVPQENQQTGPWLPKSEGLPVERSAIVSDARLMDRQESITPVVERDLSSAESVRSHQEPDLP